MESMQQLWDRLEAWARTNAQRSLNLRPPATEAAIAAAEAELGYKFPEDHRSSLLLHDGQDGTDSDPATAPFPWLPGASPLKPLADVVARWREEQDLAEDEPDPTAEGPLYTTLWHPRRIPIAGNQWWDGDNTYVDLHPSPAGTAGQIISFVTECDLVCLGASLKDALTKYVEALESGAWVWNPERNEVTRHGLPSDEYPNQSDEWARYLGYVPSVQRGDDDDEEDEDDVDIDDDVVGIQAPPLVPATKAAKKPAKKPAAKKPAKKPAAKKPAKKPAAKKPATKKPATKKPATKAAKKPAKKPAKKATKQAKQPAKKRR